jgi:hypothetical protein
MPQNSDIQAVIETILRDDAEPPDENYSPVEFAATLARSLSRDEVRELIRAAIRRLPASLAASILEGVSSFAANALDPQLLFDTISSGRQVESAGAVVQFIVSTFSVAPDDVAAELFRRLDRASESEVQNRYSFGLWTLFCGETLLIAENKVVGHLVSPADEEIGRQLLRRDFSQYAKEVLRECQVASHGGDTAGA